MSEALINHLEWEHGGNVIQNEATQNTARNDVHRELEKKNRFFGVYRWSNYRSMVRKPGYVLYPKRLHLKPKGQDGYIPAKGKPTTFVEDIIKPIGDGYLISNLGII